MLAGAGVGSAKSSLLFLKMLAFGEDFISDETDSKSLSIYS
jgi:hypothetical protein